MSAAYAELRYEAIDLVLQRHLEARGCSPVLGRSAALLSLLARAGHSCLPLEVFAGQLPPEAEPDAADHLPELEAWEQALASEELVARADDTEQRSASAAFVLDGRHRLFLRRFWHAEQDCARALVAGFAEQLPMPEEAWLAERLDRCFADDPADGQTPHWQRIAVLAAMRHRFACITGGPGTGKTFTAAIVLTMLLEAEPELRIAVAAPTGKAAARLRESLRGLRRRVDLPGSALLPDSVHTLHRLLGYLPGDDRFRHDARAPLAFDCVVVDEVSMVDLQLAGALLAALPPRCRLILLGDSEQLPAVDVGSVLADCCTVGAVDSGGHSPAFAERVERLAHGSPPIAARPLGDGLVRLQHNYRAGSRPSLCAAAEAMRRADSATLGRLLGTGDDELQRYELDELDLQRGGSGAGLRRHIWQHISAYLGADDAETAAALRNRLQILCAAREGPTGVQRVNDLIEGWMGTGDEDFYHGRPLLITANDPQTGLANGDTGFCWRDAEHGLRILFATADGGYRSLPPSWLPAHETAWAMTIHKSQGSEWNEVLCLLPDANTGAGQLLSIELLYTALTRASDRFVLVEHPGAWRNCLLRRATRYSGLTDALRAAQMATRDTAR